MAPKIKSRKANNASKPAALDIPKGTAVHSFVRVRDNAGLAVPASFDTGLAWSFKLQDIPDFSEYTNLYDAYIIDQVDLHYVLDQNQDNVFPTLVSAPDYDDDNAVVAINEILERPQAKIMAFSANKREHVISVRPRVAMQTYRPGLANGYGWGKSGQLIDIANADVPFFGIKTWLHSYNTTVSPTAKINVWLRYHLRCVAVR